ncbi:unnamed protein product [Allacma fusca]|uniref:C2H2-type domain-containing protein n=1 Tax=Allacma fusca TaxID=39272 RepID=A0A8J2NI73_9HEXA|nr:unnamed protein product [Allacma fusca]
MSTHTERNISETETLRRKSYVCEVCSKSFHNSSNLKKHKGLIHFAPRQFVCEITGCRRAFRTQQLLEKHRLNHSEERRLKCDMCPMTFVKLSGLEMHVVREHVVDKEFQCLVCEKGFITKKDLQDHMNDTHDRDKSSRFQCDLCPASFSGRRSLRLHLHKVHPDSKRCDLCSRAFVNQDELDLHSVIEVETKTNSCSECSLSFQSKCILNQHFLSSHENRNPGRFQTVGKAGINEEYGEFNCMLCESKYDRKSYLHCHEVTVHANADWPCRICSKVFTRKYVMILHEINVHGKESSFICEKCSKGCKSLVAYKKHLRIHDKQFKCDKCPKVFPSQRPLRIHKANIHEEGDRPYKCPKCPARFTLLSYLRTNHLPSHSDERPFACDKCPLRFKTKKCMAAHMQRNCSLK